MQRNAQTTIVLVDKYVQSCTYENTSGDQKVLSQIKQEYKTLTKVDQENVALYVHKQSSATACTRFNKSFKIAGGGVAGGITGGSIAKMAASSNVYGSMFWGCIFGGMAVHTYFNRNQNLIDDNQRKANQARLEARAYGAILVSLDLDSYAIAEGYNSSFDKVEGFRRRHGR